jgi:hypothetical protein
MAASFRTADHMETIMGLNWKSVQTVHVTQACETLLKSAAPRAKVQGLIVTYKNKQLPAKPVLRFDNPLEF